MQLRREKYKASIRIVTLVQPCRTDARIRICISKRRLTIYYARAYAFQQNKASEDIPIRIDWNNTTQDMFLFLKINSFHILR